MLNKMAKLRKNILRYLSSCYITYITYMPTYNPITFFDLLIYL